MNGAELMSNLIDELDRARKFIYEYLKNHLTERETLSEDEMLLYDIQSDLDRYYDYKDSFDKVLKGVEIDY